MDKVDLAESLRAPGITLGISPEYKGRFLSRCSHPAARNALWNDWIAPSLYDEDLSFHVPMHESKETNFAHQGSLQALRLLETDDPAQQMFALFSNGLKVPAFQDDDGSWEPPKQRGTVAPFQVFTFEADNTDLQTQCDWVWAKCEDEPTLLERLDRHLAKLFKDYRGYTVVWSGNKSLHIHFLFSSRHLNQHAIEVLAQKEGKNPEAQLRDHWRGDINPDNIWAYHPHCWNKLEALLRSVTDIQDEFDTNLRLLHQKRRLPWGVRIAEDNNRLGFMPGDAIPQIVLDENLRKTSAKGAQGYFLSAVEANDLPAAKVPKPSSGRCSSEIYVDELLPALTDYLRAGWQSEYPKPAKITEEANGVTVWFYNSPADAKPSSSISEDYRAIVWRGRDIPTGEKYKPLPDTSFTLGELLADLQEEIDVKRGLSGSTAIPNCARRWTPEIRTFARKLRSTAPKHMRAAMSVLAWQVACNRTHSVIVSAEGGGKTTAAIRDAGRFRLDDMLSKFFDNTLVAPENGFQVVAASSYKQAQEHYEAYREWWKAQTSKASIDLPAPVLLQSFSELYVQHCDQNGIDPTGYTEALKMGYNSLVEAVAKEQPTVFTELNTKRDRLWQVPDGGGVVQNGFTRNTSVLLFTSHDMAQNFNRPSISKAWLNPSFHEDMIGDPEQWRPLAMQFTLYRVIHDEASIADLIDIESAGDVKTARKFRKLVQSKADCDWSKVSQSQRYEIFIKHGSKKMRKLRFLELCRIIDIGFDENDRREVDFDAHPFGINNSDDAMYLSTDGDEYFIKPRAWWKSQRARVLITTTENMIAQITRKLKWDTQTEDGHTRTRAFAVRRTDHEEFVSPDSVRLICDKRASKDKIDALVADRIDSGFDFVISDMTEGFKSRVSSHVSARGRNDLQDKNISTILTFLSQDEYCKLNIISQFFGIDKVYHVHYRDRLNQAVGRNRGLRRNPTTPCDHEIIVSPNLFRCLGKTDFFASGRYPAYLLPSLSSPCGSGSHANLPTGAFVA